MAARSFTTFLLTAILATVLAGCLDAGTGSASAKQKVDLEAMPHSHGGMAKATDFTLDMGRCEEGGFVAAYPYSGEGAKLANGAWQRVDITKEIGSPIRDGNGRPVNGAKLWGNWHQGYRCDEVNLNGVKQAQFQMGWIGNMIAPPAWDEGGADLHFVISGLGFINGSIADAFKDSNTAGISMSRQALVTWYVPRTTPRSAVFAVYDDVQKGTYSSYSEMYKFRDVEPRTIRLWWQVPVDGSEQAPHGHDEADAAGFAMSEGEHPMAWHPIYWDIKSGGSEQYVTPPIDSPEVACHTNAGDAHGGVGAACQPTLTNVHEHKSLTFVQGKVFTDVTLDAMWDH